jgi:hypothetical protein
MRDRGIVFWTVIKKEVILVTIDGRKRSFFEIEAWGWSPIIDAILPR